MKHQGLTMFVFIAVCATAIAFGGYSCGGSADGADAGTAAGDGAGGDDGAGGTDAGGDAVDGGRDALLKRYIHIVYREKMAECVPALTKQLGSDLDAMEVRIFETMNPVLDLPGMTVNYATAACADATEALSCSDIIRIPYFQKAVPAACGFDASRALADGTPCVYPYQCASLICARRWDTSCGVCAAALKTGDPCDDSMIMFESLCGIGSTCAGGVCKPFGKTGAQCNVTTAPCFSDLGCVGGICGPLSGRGDACAAIAGECDPFKEGLYCDPGLQKCVAMKWGVVGDKCGLTDNGLVVCSGSDCFPNAYDGTCTAYQPDGAACNGETGPGCGVHARCVNAVCEQYFTPVCE